MNCVRKQDDSLNILLIEDNDQHAKIVTRHLRNLDELSLVRKSRLSEGLIHIERDDTDLILLDLRLPDSDLDTTFQKTVQVCSSLPIIVLSSLEDRDLAKDLVRAGAQDYLCKSHLTEEILVRAIYHARERKQIERRLVKESELRIHLHAISQIGLSTKNLNRFIASSSEVISSALGVEMVTMFKTLVDYGQFRLEGGAGHNLKNSVSTMISFSELVPEGFIVDYLDNHSSENTLAFQTFFAANCSSYHLHIPLFLQKQGMKSGLGATVAAVNDLSYGVLAVYTKEKRIFGKDEILFIKSAANILSAAIQRFQLEEKLRDHVAELSLEHRKKDQFLSILSHELRTPLGVISGYAEQLRELPPHSSQFINAINTITKNAKAELRLINDTLDLSRMITGQFDMEVSPFLIQDVIDDALATVSLATQSKEIIIKKNIADNIGHYRGDEHRLQQVLWNLFTNSVKFTPQKGTISVSARKNDGQIEIEVRDTGKGIEPRDLPYVFDRFWQEDSSKSRHFGGLGLGLSIVRQIVEAHGGTVECMSEGKNKGTTFKIQLPMSYDIETTEKTDIVPIPVNLPKSSKCEPGRKLAGLRILLVEDYEEACTLFKVYLESESAIVFDKTLPTDALALFFEKMDEIDLIISDIGLPGMSGFELLECFRDLKESIPVIALSAYTGDEEKQKIYGAGFNLHLEKPIERNSFVDQIANLIDQH